MKPNQSEITDLTICRAIFAAWVFIYHIDLHTQVSAWLGPFSGLITHGYLGVDGFFILSGLILARVHPNIVPEPTVALQFWGKRLARLYPVHLATLIVLLTILITGLALGASPHSPARFTTLSFIENLLLIHGWGLSNYLAWNYPSWSISTEWAGYLLFPIAWFFLSVWDASVIFGLIAICIPILGVVDYFSGAGLNVTFGGALFRFFPEFVMGLSAARLVPLYADETPAAFLTYFGLVIALTGALAQADVLTIIGLFLTLTATAMQSDAQRPPIFPPHPAALFLGRLSYAFYMSFGTAELLVSEFFRHHQFPFFIDGLIFTTGMTVLTLAYAIILHILIEIPARKAADRYLQTSPPLAGTGMRL